MIRFTKVTAGIAVLLGTVCGAGAFSLLGPLKNGANGFPDPWQGAGYGGRPQGLGYELGGDIGGPMLYTEGYRWNLPVVTYAFDLSFLQYFGTEGVAAVEEAIGILNALPSASKMSPSLSEFSLDTKSENGTAAPLGLLDLKSFTLATLLEQMGLANPERFVWGLRGRVAGNGFTNYTTINLNYDPVTVQPSRYVNGALYNYQIFDDLGPIGGEWASAVEWYQLDPLFQPYSSVAHGNGNGDFELGTGPGTVTGVFSGLQSGQYFTGLTRDDVGAIRYLLHPNNLVVESLLPTVRSSFGAGSPWTPFIGGTNTTGTNITGSSNLLGGFGTNATNMIRTALRPGVNKITFRRVKLNLPASTFTPFTIQYTDRYIDPITFKKVSRPVERLVLQPDIIFRVTDLGTVQEVPVTASRTGTANWVNNATNNFSFPLGMGGPGVISPPVVITYGNMVPYFLNLAAGDGDIEHFPGFIWGSFDGTDTPPVVYPISPTTQPLTLSDLRRYFLRKN